MTSLLQQLQVFQESLEKAKLRRLPVRAGRPRRHVHRDHPKLAEARFDVAAFGIELPDREATPHFVGLPAAHQRDAAVALLLGEGVAGREALQAVQLRVEVELLALDLLQADDVRTLRREPAEQALARGRAQPVDVQRDDAHGGAPFYRLLDGLQDSGKADTPPCRPTTWRGVQEALDLFDHAVLEIAALLHHLQHVPPGGRCRSFTWISAMIFFDSGKMS